MKRFYLICGIIFLITVQPLFGQLKVGYVDSDTIMNEISDVKDIQKQIDQLVKEWQDDLDKMKNEWQKKFDEYEKTKIIMSDKKRMETEKELVEMEKEIQKFRQNKFGVNGELFQKEEELMKPVQNRIFNAIDQVAKDGDYDFIFDRSGDILFLFAKEKHDVTNDVLDKLQIIR